MRHRFHSLCPYFAMFPEAFVERWVSTLTKPGEAVLDPFCGRGTTPFQALLMGRQATACDINPVAFCITKAKTNAPAKRSVLQRLAQLEENFEPEKWERARLGLPEFFSYAYKPGTLRQLLFLRSQLRWQESDTDCMTAALVLGSLHGESERSSWYLSNQMPRTISTKPAYSIRFWKRHRYDAPKRDTFALLRGRLDYRYESDPPAGRARVLRTDMRELPRLTGRPSPPIRCVITSPPYLNVTSFEEDQWLRLWFLGGPPHPTYGLVSRDDRHKRQERYWDFVLDMWRVLGCILDRRAYVVLRLGGKDLDPNQIASAVSATAAVSQRKVTLVHSEVSEIRHRQTDAFRPGSTGCVSEVDLVLRMQ